MILSSNPEDSIQFADVNLDDEEAKEVFIQYATDKYKTILTKDINVRTRLRGILEDMIEANLFWWRLSINDPAAYMEYQIVMFVNLCTVYHILMLNSFLLKINLDPCTFWLVLIKPSLFRANPLSPLW